MSADVLLDLIGVLPNHLLHGYMCCRMLTMRNTPLFWALYLAAVLFSTLKGSMQFAVQAGFFFGMLLVIPIALSKGPLAHRVMATALLLVAILLADSLLVPVWYFVAGYPISEHYAVTSDPAGYVFARVVSYPLLFVLLVLARVVYDRVIAAKSDDDLVCFMGFVITQAALLFALVYLFENIPGYRDEAMVLAVVYFAVSSVADVYLMVSLDRLSKARRRERQAAELEERLEQSLARYQHMVREVEHAAKVRHEVRGQVQAIGYLADSGDKARACQLADDMIVEIREGAHANADVRDAEVRA